MSNIKKNWVTVLTTRKEYLESKEELERAETKKRLLETRAREEHTVQRMKTFLEQYYDIDFGSEWGIFADEINGYGTDRFYYRVRLKYMNHSPYQIQSTHNITLAKLEIPSVATQWCIMVPGPERNPLGYYDSLLDAMLALLEKMQDEENTTAESLDWFFYPGNTEDE